MSRKLILSLMIMALAAAAVGAGTWAYFQDTETSTGNSFTAGTMDLKIDGADDPVAQKIVCGPIKPGDNFLRVKKNGQDVQVLLTNTGSVGGKISFTLEGITQEENNILEPEANAGDITPLVGELGPRLTMATDENPSPNGPNDWNNWAPTSLLVPASNGVVVHPQASGSHGEVPADVYLAPGQTIPLVFYYSWADGGAADSQAMGDSVVFNIRFHLEQDH